MRPLRVHRRPALLALLLVAFVARGLIPSGFMPAPHAGLGLQLMLCTADGLAPEQHYVEPGVHFATDGAAPGAPAPHGDSDHSSPCAYATAATFAPPPGLPAASLLPAAAPTAHEHFVTTDARPSIVRAQSPRAPPAHV